MAPLRLSPTNLDRWFTLGCPAAWDFAYRLSPVEKNPYAEFGTAVHAHLAGEDDVKLQPQELVSANKIWTMATVLGLRDLPKPIIEFKQEWKLANGFVFVRKVDRIMQDPSGRLVIVDWKTHAGYGWKTLASEDDRKIVPQSLAAQTPGYFLEPPKKLLKELGLSSWPTVMYYIVGPLRGAAQYFIQERTDEGDANFQQLLTLAIQAIQTAKDAEFPKVYGKHCFDCEFQSACFELPGWELRYDDYRK